MPAVKTTAKKTTTPSPVSFVDNDSDFRVVTLANFGLSLKAIAEHTGLTTCQVSYRCRHAGVSVRDYRNLRNEHAIRVAKSQDSLFSKKEIAAMRVAMEEVRTALLQKLRKVK